MTSRVTRVMSTDPWVAVTETASGPVAAIRARAAGSAATLGALDMVMHRSRLFTEPVPFPIRSGGSPPLASPMPSSSPTSNRLLPNSRVKQARST